MPRTIFCSPWSAHSTLSSNPWFVERCTNTVHRLTLNCLTLEVLRHLQVSCRDIWCLGFSVHAYSPGYKHSRVQTTNISQSYNLCSYSDILHSKTILKRDIHQYLQEGIQRHTPIPTGSKKKQSCARTK